MPYTTILLSRITTIYGKTRQNTGHTPEIKQIAQNQKAIGNKESHACRTSRSEKEEKINCKRMKNTALNAVFLLAGKYENLFNRHVTL
jgi:hypothetical protein